MDVENIEALLENILKKNFAWWRKMPVDVLDSQGYFIRAKREGRKVQNVYRLVLEANHVAELEVDTSRILGLIRREHYIFRVHHGAPYINPPVVEEERKDLKGLYSALEHANLC